MEPRTLRELIIDMTAGHGGAYNRNATIGEVLRVARMALAEIEDLEAKLASK